jgi:hypothetical protein
MMDDHDSQRAHSVVRLAELATWASGEDRARMDRTIQLVDWAHRAILRTRQNEQASLAMLWQTKTLTLRLLVEVRQLDEKLQTMRNRARE